MEGQEGRVPARCHSHNGTQAYGASTVWSQFLCQERENSELYTSSHTSTCMWLMMLLPTCTGQIKPGGHIWYHEGGEYSFTMCLNLAKILVKMTVTKFYEIKLNSTGWHHQLNWHEFEQALGDGEGQGSLVCCSPWVSRSWTWLSDWTTTVAPGSHLYSSVILQCNVTWK